MKTVIETVRGTKYSLFTTNGGGEGMTKAALVVFRKNEQGNMF